MLTIVFVHRGSIRDVLPGAARLCTAAAFFVVPFLVFLALNGGISEYFRLASIYVQRDAQRTSFSFPRLSFDSSRPLLAIKGLRQEGVAAVNVRWRSVSEEQRRDREKQYGLRDGTAVEGTTWKYRLVDVSRSNIEALVRDPLVDDTSGIDRATFAVVARDSIGVETPLDSVENATAFLYYAFLTLPFIAGAVLLQLQKAAGATRVMSSMAHIGPLLGLAIMLSAGFMSRGSTNIRIPDVGVTSAVLLAWLMATVMGRDAPLVAASRAMRACFWIVAVTGLALSVFSVNGLAHTARTLRDTGFASGPARVAERAGAVWRSLGRDPSAFIDEDEQPGLLKIAGYVRACTEPGDRLFVLGVYPELYYFADRPFAGGHAWLLPLYYSGPDDEARVVARLKAARVPIVLTEDRATYDREYRPVFEQIDKYLRDHYVDVGQIGVDDVPPLRALVHAGIAPIGRYDPLGLPCFAPSNASAPPS
jgi:hypothetical protein